MLQLSNYFDLTTTEKAKELEQLLVHQQIYTAADTGIIRQNINRYIKSGVISPSRQSEGGNYKYNLLELVWLRIITELLSFNYPIDSLRILNSELNKPLSEKSLYTFLENNPSLIETMPIAEKEKEKLRKELKSGNWKKQNSPEAFSQLHLLVAHSIVHRENVCIAVFINGVFTPLIEAIYKPENKQLQNKLKSQTYISVSISTLLRDLIGENRYADLLPRIGIFSEKELKVMEQIKTGDYKTVTVHFKNKEIDSLELVKAEEVRRKVMDVISDNDYSEIRVKKHDGKIVSVEQTAKIKVR